MKRLTLIIINQTSYENSDWSRVSSQYTIECEVDMIIQYLQRLIIMGVLFKRLFKICIIKKLLNSVFVWYHKLSASALADNSDLGIDNSLYHAQPHQLNA